MQDYNDIYSIVERLRILEEGLDKNQKSVNQLSATFKPKTVAVLTAKTDPKNPMAGKLVGGGESVEHDEAVLEAEMAEDVLDKVKASFADYLKNVADEIKQDSDLKDKTHEDSDLKKKEKQDRDLVTRIEEDPTEEEPTTGSVQQPTINPTYAESAPVKVMTLEDGTVFEIHGDDHHGFNIRRGGRRMKSKFKNLDHAVIALEMYMHHRQAGGAQDYIDEA